MICVTLSKIFFCHTFFWGPFLRLLHISESHFFKDLRKFYRKTKINQFCSNKGLKVILLIMEYSSCKQKVNWNQADSPLKFLPITSVVPLTYRSKYFFNITHIVGCNRLKIRILYHRGFFTLLILIIIL